MPAMPRQEVDDQDEENPEHEERLGQGRLEHLRQVQHTLVRRPVDEPAVEEGVEEAADHRPQSVPVPPSTTMISSASVKLAVVTPGDELPISR